MRTTLLLRGLTGLVIVTAGVGLVPGMHLAWIFTGITGVAALGLVWMIGYARELEANRRSHLAAAALHRQWSESDAEFGYETTAASAGYPGAWDEPEYEEYELPQQAAAGR